MSLDNDNPQDIEARVRNILTRHGYDINFFIDQPPIAPLEEVSIAYLLKKLEEKEQAVNGFRDALDRLQKVVDKTAIDNSHLKVENDCLRREIAHLQSLYLEPTQTALDFEPPKRHWTFWNRNSFKGFRLIGREVK